ncbi:tripartite motif-containing protein 16-like protein [Gymnodraco acuticeps]|uniref:Tripartite motif-containing protein 16-like protein n=1 Tax=Gymnodraco acuticeps TaxID=8218 RepID=A0A6P8TR02_GYMAC|nr:tripartite motif-containing protein 16-like protein [Gymnodraco acuticeps]
MAQQRHQRGRDELCCFICKNLMKDPVTIACGYSYCKSCISRRWDREKEQNEICSCPHCRRTFESRPVLVISTLLANLVEEEKKKTEPKAGPSDPFDAGPGEVGCSPTGRKRKTSSLQPHYEDPLKKTKLIEASKRHEMSEKQKEQKIQQKIQIREKDLKELQPEVKYINRSAEKAVRESETMCTELVKLIEKISSDVKQKIMSRQKYEVSRVKKIQDTLQNDIKDLKKKYTKLEKVSKVNKDPVRYFDDVTAAVSVARGKVLEKINKEWMKISKTVTEVDVRLLPDPQTKADFSQYAGPKNIFELDPNTASMKIQLSEDNMKATNHMTEPQSYDDHADRFMARSQVLCRKALTNRCYWEVEWSGLGVSVAVTYKDVPRTGKESAFGDNDKSWALEFSKTICHFKHNREKKAISVPESSRIGVLLDPKAGVLSFHSVSETITLLHRVETKFTQPLYAGLGVYYNGASATFCDTKVEQLSSEVSEN